jgi:hypothetical protein
VYGLNVPVPGEVKRVAADLLPRLVAFERVRKDHALLAKRFESVGPAGGERNRQANQELATLRERVRPVLADASAFDARVTGLGCFETPVRGPGPIVYLAVESPGLDRLHRRLVEEFGAVSGLEGEAYTPHVTLARGGAPATARELVDETAIEPVEWTVSELRFFDPRRRETVGRVSLPSRGGQ